MTGTAGPLNPVYGGGPHRHVVPTCADTDSFRPTARALWEEHSDSSAGNNRTLSISARAALGDPLDASTPTTPGSIARRSTKFINLVGVTASLLTVQGVTDPDGTALS